METNCKPKTVVKLPQKMRKILIVNVRGTEFRIEHWLIEKYPDSALEVIFSDRHDMTNTKSKHPFLDRDPNIFKKMIDLLTKYKNLVPGSTYINIYDEEVLDELEFLCIDFMESNRIFMSQQF